MRMSFLFAVLVGSLLVLETSGLHELPLHARGGEFGRHLKDEIKETSDVRYITLPVDHNDPSKGNFSNRYYADFSRWDGSGPCFFIMGGEGPNNGIGENYMTYLADKHDALLVSIEHRFYGISVPNKDMSVTNLKYLSSRQALADAAHLIDYINQQHSTCTWISFGGSYSGALSAWFRVKYPDRVSGALASSGVVNAILNYTGYDEQIAEAIGESCADDIRYITDAFGAAESQGQGAHSRRLFGIRPDLDYGDFAYMLADSAATADQYGNKKVLCDELAGVRKLAPSQAMELYANFTLKYWGTDFPTSCFYDPICLKNTSIVLDTSSRSWWWQKCTELAYFQTAPSKGSLRLPVVSVEYHRKKCGDVFGNGVFPDVDATNDYYGGATPRATNIFFSDFSDDPWQRASVRKELSKDLPFELVKCDGCGHCMDYRKPNDNDPEVLKKERQRFEHYLNQWILS